LSRRKQLVEEYFDSTGEDDWSPRYNIAPTQPVPVIRQQPKEPVRQISLMKWVSFHSDLARGGDKPFLQHGGDFKDSDPMR
jgi:putative SOS response-associated peptidase YedK